MRFFHGCQKRLECGDKPFCVFAGITVVPLAETALLRVGLNIEFGDSLVSKIGNEFACPVEMVNLPLNYHGIELVAGNDLSSIADDASDSKHRP